MSNEREWYAASSFPHGRKMVFLMCCSMFFVVLQGFLQKNAKQGVFSAVCWLVAAASLM